MPVSVRVSNRRMPNVRPMQTGGYEAVTGRPDPNDAFPTWMRGQQGGQAENRFGLGANIALAQQGRAATDADYAAAAQEPRALGAPAQMVRSLPNPAWDAFFGALQNRGVERLQTGAAHRGWGDAPGFFDTQGTSGPMQGLMQSRPSLAPGNDFLGQFDEGTANRARKAGQFGRRAQ
jgi:hypothetical protein